MRTCTTLLLTLVLISACQRKFDRSKISIQVDNLVTELAGGMLEGAFLGEGGSPSRQYKKFEKLEKQATQEELKELTNHPDPTVRCYALQALSNDSTADLLPILLNHINDHEKVDTFFGCRISRENVGDFFIRMILPMEVSEEGVIEEKPRLDSARLAILDSALIYTPNNLEALSAAIARLKPTEAIYPRIRTLATTRQSDAALIKLAGYQKQQDVIVIINRLSEFHFFGRRQYAEYQAISRFPHPDFFPWVEAEFHRKSTRDRYNHHRQRLYNAIASYKSERALALLNQTLSDARHQEFSDDYIDFVATAAHEFKAPVYDDLLWKLWSDKKRITTDVFRYLLNKDPEKAFQLAKESLTQSDLLLSYLERREIYDPNENPMPDMFDLVIKRDKAFGYDILRKSIREGNSAFKIFAHKAAALKDTACIPLLLHQLQTESNPYICESAALALTAYHDLDLNKKMVAACKKNKSLSEGISAIHLDRILKEHGVDAQLSTDQ